MSQDVPEQIPAADTTDLQLPQTKAEPEQVTFAFSQPTGDDQPARAELSELVEFADDPDTGLPRAETDRPPRPEYWIYSPAAVAWAAFWGGYLGGGIVLARNFWAIQRRVSASVMLILSALATSLLVLLLVADENNGAIGIALLNTFVMWAIATGLQGGLYRRHQIACGSSGALTGAFGFGLLGYLVTIVLAVALGLAVDTHWNPELGTRIAVGDDDEVWYSGQATADEAKRLGDFLISTEYFDTSSSRGVAIRADKATVALSIYRTDQWDDPQLGYEYEEYALDISEKVFAGRSVQLLIRDESGELRNQLIAMKPSAVADWQAIVDMADKAAEAVDYATAETHHRLAVAEAEKHECLHRRLVWSLNNVGNDRLNQDLVDDVEPHFQRALRLAKFHCGKDSYEEGYAINGLARWEEARKNWSAAEKYYRRAIVIREKLDANRAEECLTSYQSLSSVLLIQEKLKDAAETQQRLVDYYERHLAVLGGNLAEEVFWLGRLQGQNGEYEKSRSTLERARQLFDASEGDSNADLLECLLHLGLVSFGLGDYTQAETYYVQGIELLELSRQPSLRQRLAFKGRLADLHVAQSRHAEAEILYRTVLLAQQNVPNVQSLTIAESACDLAKALLEQAKYGEAEKLLHQAKRTYAEASEGPRQKVADCEWLLARMHHAQGNYATAELHYEQTIAINKQIFGAEHDLVAAALGDLCDLKTDQQDYAAAETLAWQTHETLQKALKSQHPALIASLRRIARLQCRQNELEQAEKTVRSAVEMAGGTVGMRHTAAAEAQNQLGHILFELKRSDEAEPIFRQALETYEELLGPEHPELVGPLNNLSLVLEETGREVEAEQTLTRAVAVLEKAFGEEHPLLLIVLGNHARILRKLDRPDEARALERRMESIWRSIGPQDNAAPPVGNAVT